MNPPVVIATPEVVADANAKRLLSDLIEVCLDASEGLGGISDVRCRSIDEVTVKVAGVRYRIEIKQDV